MIMETTSNDYANRKNTARKTISPEDRCPYIEASLPCPYTHRIFEAAGIIFDSLKFITYSRSQDIQHLHAEDTFSSQAGNRTPSRNRIYMDNIDLGSDKEKRLAFELAFSTLKCQKFLIELLDRVYFFTHYPEMREVGGIVMVMLYDLQNRKFQRSTNIAEPRLEELDDIEALLLSYRTKLKASIAKMRIKMQALDVENLIPNRVHNRTTTIDGRKKIHAWVNNHKARISDVADRLLEDGLHLISDSNEDRGNSCCFIDMNCPDVLTFDASQREFLLNHDLVRNGHMILQDKSSCIAAHSAKALLNDGDDVMIVNVGSGLTAAQLSSLTAQSDTRIYVTGIRSGKHRREVQQKLALLGAKNVVLLEEEFAEMDPYESLFQHVKVILLMANCSRSAVVNPVDFIVNEGEDVSILKALSVGSHDDVMLDDLISQQYNTLKHALSFPKCQGLVYFTRSVNSSENGYIVNKVVHHVNARMQRKSLYLMAPPTIPLTDDDVEADVTLTHQGRYLFYLPSESMSGCFVSVIVRQADDPKEAARDILARAAAKGLLGEDADVIKPPKNTKKKRQQFRMDNSPIMPWSTDGD